MAVCARKNYLAAADPGLGTFLTIFSWFDNKTFTFGRNLAQRMWPVEQARRQRQSEGNEVAKRLLQSKKIAVRRDQLHKTAVRFITKCFELFVLPPPLKSHRGQSSYNQFRTNMLGLTS